MSRFPNRRWLIISADDVENINFNQVLESGSDTLRYSVDGTKTFVKYEVTVVEQDEVHTFTDPETEEEQTTTVLAGVYGRPSIYQESMTEYTHSEILELLATEEWTAPELGEK
jgi:hypothetical protein